MGAGRSKPIPPPCAPYNWPALRRRARLFGREAFEIPIYVRKCGTRRAAGKDKEVPRRPSEPMSCAASTTEGMGRQQSRDSSMAATATGMEDRRCSEARKADGTRDGAPNERRRRESVENSGEGSSSSSGADPSSNCSSTNVHGTHTERGEIADRTAWRQRRQADMRLSTVN